MNKKEALEHYAVHKFITKYNEAHNNQIQFVKLLSPPEPDALCRICDGEIGIEVTHLYGSSINAQRILKSSDPRTENEKLADVLVPLEQRMLTELNGLLSKKATKQYSRSSVWLLMRNAFPLWNRQDFEAYKGQIIVPHTHPFQRIWLLDNNTDEILSLY